MKVRYGRVVLAALELAAVWPFIFAFLAAWPQFVGDSRRELAGFDALPRILQGDDTYGGGGNVFAMFVVGQFIFGAAGCVLFALMLSSQSYFRAIERVLIGFVAGWTLSVSAMLIPFAYRDRSVAIGTRDPVDMYYICDYIQVTALFGGAYLLSTLWIRFLSVRRTSRGVRVILAPTVIALLAVIGSGGISPKAGWVVHDDKIYGYHSNGTAHEALLLIHRFCTHCSGGNRAISP